MTAITPDALQGFPLRAARSGRAQRRLIELSREERGQAGWWVEVTRQLDDLAEAVLASPGDVVDALGLTEQFRSDAPHLVGRWQRLSREREGLFEQVCQVRLLAGSSAGDPLAVGPVSRAVRTVVARVRRFQERTTDVLLDAYARDMGGE
jgi:hypothetical protein